MSGVERAGPPVTALSIRVLLSLGDAPATGDLEAAALQLPPLHIDQDRYDPRQLRLPLISEVGRCLPCCHVGSRFAPHIGDGSPSCRLHDRIEVRAQGESGERERGRTEEDSIGRSADRAGLHW